MLKKKAKVEFSPSTATYSNIKFSACKQLVLHHTSCCFTGMEVTVQTRAALKHAGVDTRPHGSGTKLVCKGCKTHIPALPELYESCQHPRVPVAEGSHAAQVVARSSACRLCNAADIIQLLPGAGQTLSPCWGARRKFAMRRNLTLDNFLHLRLRSGCLAELFIGTGDRSSPQVLFVSCSGVLSGLTLLKKYLPN